MSRKFQDKFLKLAKARKTTYEFTKEEVKKRDVTAILEAGRWAPSCSNTQPWKFIIVRSKKKIAELNDLCFYYGFHYDPPIIIAVVLDKKKTCAIEHCRGKNDEYISIGCTIMNMAYEAETRGIASCILSPEFGKAEKLLRVPKKVEVPVLMGFGYEKKRKKSHINKMRKPLKELLYFERFGRRKE